MTDEIIYDICKNLRPIIRSKREGAFRKLQLALEETQINQVMVELMGYAQWVRIDLDLLLSAALWLNLTEAELGGRIAADQRDMVRTFAQRTNVKERIIDDLLAEAQLIQDNSPYGNRKVENNREILEQNIWHREELRTLYAYFHGMLSKFGHPDPYFVFFQESLFHQIKENLAPMFYLCADEIDKQWDELEGEVSRAAEKGN